MTVLRPLKYIAENLFTT